MLQPLLGEHSYGIFMAFTGSAEKEETDHVADPRG